MRVNILYSSEDAMMLSSVAETIAERMTEKLQPLANEIDNERALIIFHFGCRDFTVEINASPQLQNCIEEMLGTRAIA